MLLKISFVGWKNLVDGASLVPSRRVGRGKTLRSHKPLHQVHLYGPNGSGKTATLEGIKTLLRVALMGDPVPQTKERSVIHAYFEVDGHKIFLGLGFCDGVLQDQELWIWGPRVKGARGVTLFALEDGRRHRNWPAKLVVDEKTPLAFQILWGGQLEGPFAEAQHLLRTLASRAVFPDVSEESFWRAARDPSFREFFKEWTYHLNHDLRLVLDRDQLELRGYQGARRWDQLSKGVQRVCCLAAALYPLRVPGTMVLVDDLDLHLDLKSLDWIAENTPRESQLILTARTPVMVLKLDLDQINGLSVARRSEKYEVIAATEYKGLASKNWRQRQKTLMAILQKQLWGGGGSLSYEGTPPWWRV